MVIVIFSEGIIEGLNEGAIEGIKFAVFDFCHHWRQNLL